MLLRAIEGTATLRRHLATPALAPLVAATRVTIGAAGNDPGFLVPGPGQLVLSPALAERAGTRLYLRLGLELAWLVGVPDLPAPIALLFAARIAARQQRRLPTALAPGDPAEALRGQGEMVLDRIACLAAPTPPPPETLATLAAALAPHLPAAAGEIWHDGLLPLLETGWRVAAPLEELLAADGDERLVIDPVRGLNRYGCAPHPRPEAIGFSSCTASSISSFAYDAAEQARQELIAATLRSGFAAALAAASDRVRHGILAHYGVADIADAVLAASGTDAALLATGLLGAEHPRGERLTSIIVSPAETGSGIPDAVRGRHFAATAAGIGAVPKSGCIDGFPAAIDLLAVPLRKPDGTLREPAAVEAACSAAVASATLHGRAVLHVIEGSKTGLSAPGMRACQRLARQYAGRLEIVVDACQARLPPEQLRRYLEQGWPVLLTGSKFFGAPGFCGVVLFPRGRLRRIAASGAIPSGLSQYSTGFAHAPAAAAAAPGPLLRWTAALAEMARFRAAPQSRFAARLDRLGGVLAQHLTMDDRFRAIAAARSAGVGWSARQTIFTFALRRRAAQHWMSTAALQPIYRWLNTDLSEMLPGGCSAEQRRAAAALCHIGQPVEIASAAENGFGGLRIAFAAQHASGEADFESELGIVFTKLKLILDHLPLLQDLAAVG